jgi:drug/metabolite transporter (DMT)-like permease
MGFAFLGLYLILDPGRNGSSLQGTLLAILSGIFWAISAVWQKKMAPPGVDLLTVTAWQMVFGGLGLLLVALLRDPLTLHWSPSLVGALLYNALPGNALAWILWAYALRHLPSGVAGMGTLVAPLVGVLASWAQLGERPGGQEFQGMAFIFLALFLVTWQHLRSQNRFSFSATKDRPTP